jgi:hypothetical protein
MRDSLINGPKVWDYLKSHGIQGMAFDLDHAGFLFDTAEDTILNEIASVVQRDCGLLVKEVTDDFELKEGWGSGILAQGILDQVFVGEFGLVYEEWGSGVVAQGIVDVW